VVIQTPRRPRGNLLQQGGIDNIVSHVEKFVACTLEVTSDLYLLPSQLLHSSQVIVAKAVAVKGTDFQVHSSGEGDRGADNHYCFGVVIRFSLKGENPRGLFC
jgi:hypothetical protein